MPDDSGYIDVPVRGREVTQLLLDFSLGLHFGGPDDAVIYIRGPFKLLKGGEVFELDPEREPVTMAPVLHLLRAGCLEGRALSRGTLILEFDTAISITVEPNEDYEAWEFIGSKGSRIISLPGGNLAIWSDAVA